VRKSHIFCSIFYIYKNEHFAKTGSGQTQGEVEKRDAFFLCRAELLRVEVAELSCDDSFYDVGGHSLLATRVLNEMEKVLMFANGGE
jgi:hypothetical protein